MRRLLVLIFTFLYILPMVAQSKHPFTFEDMMALKRVGEPLPSPDGKWVLFSVVDVNREANTKTPHVWIVPLGGGESREIISEPSADRPRWAPDGKRFAFLSNKEGGSQIWRPMENSGRRMERTFFLCRMCIPSAMLRLPLKRLATRRELRNMRSQN